MTNDLAATVAALTDGDRVRATFVRHGTTTTIEGPIVAGGRAVGIAHGYGLRYEDGNLSADLTAVEVLAPALPPEPPVGSGVFHDGVLWWRDPITGEWWSVGDLGRALASWDDLQPCVPAVPGDYDPEVLRRMAANMRQAIDRQWDQAIAAEVDRRLAAPLSTDEPDVPVGSVAVFRRHDGSLVAVEKSSGGMWGGCEWSYWTYNYSAPVSITPFGGE